MQWREKSDKKKLFSARLASVWFKNKGWGPKPPGPSPGFTTDDVSYRLFINYSSSPNGLWVIDSEVMRARGIIVLVKSN